MRKALLVAVVFLISPWLAAAQGAAAEGPSAAQPTQETKMTQPGPSPEPLIVPRGELLLAGTRYAGDNAHGEIPAMWQQEFFPRLDELAPLVSEKGAFYGVGRALPGAMPGHFQYLAAVSVKSLDTLPTGIVGWEFPARTYAVLLARGVADIGRVNSFYDSEWLPKSSFLRDGDYMLEYYPPGFPDERIYLHFPVKPKQAGERKPMTIYRPEPTVIERGEIKLVGCEDLIVNGLTAKTKQPIPTLYQAAAQRVDKVRNALNPMIMVGANRADNPADVWAGGPGYHQLAGFEVSAFDAVPQDMTVALYAPSRYAVFTCDAPTDPATGKLLGQAEWGPVYPYYALNRARWGFKDKNYYLEFFHHAEMNGEYPIVHYELWIPVE